MSFKNNKFNTKTQKGFTIVELLIVVVVIAILAAITIVSYNGITNRANASSAKSNAAGVQKKAELYAADGPTGKYPFTISSLTGAASDKVYATSATAFNMSTAVPPVQTALDATTGKNSARVYVCTATGTPTAANISGLRIAYWDFEVSPNAETTAATSINMGTTTSCALATN